MKLADIKNAYFLGIGGIGMSAIARYFKSLDIAVAGYDKTPSPLTDALASEGIEITFIDRMDTIPKQMLGAKDETLFIYTPAIPANHEQLNYLRSLDIPVYKRSEILGLISKDAYSICIAGTHGKTTTSTMMAHVLHECNINFTAFLGGISANFKSNYYNKTDGVTLFPNKPVIVLEADEFDRSFHRLSPTLAAITNMDPDHLDIYGTVEEFQNGFQGFADKIKNEGHLFIRDGIQLKTFIPTTTYGVDCGEARSMNLRVSENDLFFDFRNENIEIKNIPSGMPGRHNVENATAVISIALKMGLPPEQIKDGIATFKGAHRRFEYIVRNPHFVVIDDYAHHPGELNAIIGAVRQLYPDKKITGIFQPHLYSRTKDFAEGFAESLSTLDELMLMDIYPARELPIAGIDSDWLLEKVHLSAKLKLKTEEIFEKIKTEKPELLLILGAGDIDRLVPTIKELYEGF